MKFYTIYFKKIADKNSYIAVEDGFNWYSLIFSIFWSIYKKVWRLMLLYIAVYSLIKLGINFNILDSTSSQIIQLIFYVALAYHANDFYRASLERKGYELQGISAGADKNMALLRFLDKE